MGGGVSALESGGGGVRTIKHTNIWKGGGAWPPTSSYGGAASGSNPNGSNQVHNYIPAGRDYNSVLGHENQKYFRIYNLLMEYRKINRIHSDAIFVQMKQKVSLIISYSYGSPEFTIIMFLCP